MRSLKATPGGSSSKAKKSYYLHDVMEFVIPYVKPVKHSQDFGNVNRDTKRLEPMGSSDREQTFMNYIAKKHKAAETVIENLRKMILLPDVENLSDNNMRQL